MKPVKPENIFKPENNSENKIAVAIKNANEEKKQLHLN